MATTLSSNFTAQNYCNLPTIDVEILDDDTLSCEICSQEITFTPSMELLRPYVHVNGDTSHKPQPLSRCRYCKAQGTITYHQHAYHDSFDCSRCGGSYGIPIGD